MEANQETNQKPDNKSDEVTDLEDATLNENNETVEASSAEDEVQAQLEQLEADNRDLKEKLLRSMADIENMRKRHQKEKADLSKYGNEKLMEDLLPALDSFSSALSSQESQSVEAYADGVLMVHKQLLSIMEKHGLKGFDSQGEEFDPNLHQAIQRVEEDVKQETVKEEFQRGYHLNERLLRPAIVSVSVPASED